MNTKFWYTNLIKPDWAPPSFLFGPVWTVLYIGIFISFGYVFYRKLLPESPAMAIPFIVVLPFILNLIFNIIFTPIQFGLKNNLLASIDIACILITLVWALIAIFPYARWVAYMNIPYLLWVCFATVLQFTITYLNN